MGSLTEANPNSRELVTEILDETLLWSAIKLVVEFLRAKNVAQVSIEFGFVLDRDIRGQEQGQDQIVQLEELESLIRTGIHEGTIERTGSSDFLFHPQDPDLNFMLCNDGDLHFASPEPSLLAELGQALRGGGIKVYDTGHPI
jgi:hypothetical protein